MIKVSLKEAEGHLGELIEEAAAGERTKTIGHSLDHLFGTWSEEEEAELLQSVEIFEWIDESFW